MIPNTAFFRKNVFSYIFRHFPRDTHSCPPPLYSDSHAVHLVEKSSLGPNNSFWVRKMHFYGRRQTGRKLTPLLLESWFVQIKSPGVLRIYELAARYFENFNDPGALDGVNPNLPMFILTPGSNEFF